MVQGQCACGASKLEIEGEAVAHFYCHCDDCQAMASAPLVGIVMFPAAAVKVSGEVKQQTRRMTPRITCASCGSRLFAEPPGMGVRGVFATTLPEGIFKPQAHIQCQHATVVVNDGLPRFKGFPAKYGGSDEMMG